MNYTYTCATIKGGGYSREDADTKVICVHFPRVLGIGLCEVLNDFEITEEMIFEDFCRAWETIVACRACTGDFNKILGRITRSRFLDSNFYKAKTSEGRCVTVTYREHLLAMIFKTIKTFEENLNKNPHKYHVLAGTSNLILFCGLKPGKFAHQYTGIYVE